MGRYETRYYPVPTLNESPSEKEGKFRPVSGAVHANEPSMKVPPKRKGNFRAASLAYVHVGPQ